jgi:hypothetical protein
MQEPVQLKTVETNLPSEVIGTVTENYGTYYELVEVVKAWQHWYNVQKQVFEEVK